MAKIVEVVCPTSRRRRGTLISVEITSSLRTPFVRVIRSHRTCSVNINVPLNLVHKPPSCPRDTLCVRCPSNRKRVVCVVNMCGIMNGVEPSDTEPYVTISKRETKTAMSYLYDGDDRLPKLVLCSKLQTRNSRPLVSTSPLGSPFFEIKSQVISGHTNFVY